jgi:hypothetical protein
LYCFTAVLDSATDNVVAERIAEERDTLAGRSGIHVDLPGGNVLVGD